MSDRSQFIVHCGQGPDAKKAIGAAKTKIATSPNMRIIDEAADALLVEASRFQLEQALGEFQGQLLVEESKAGDVKPL